MVGNINMVNEYGDGVAWFRGALLGKGGFASVYRATLKNPNFKYSYYPSIMAVKSAEVSVSSSIQKEREVLSIVKGCPDIIRCFGDEITMGKNGMMIYNMLLEFGSGGTLADRIENSGGNGLPEAEVRLYARNLLRGLSHIHALGYVHCDLKPDNVLLVSNSGKNGNCSEFRAKIGDFGLAKREIQSSKKKRKMEPYWRGTPMYLPPETLIDCVQEAPSDIWSLGCIVLEMLTGKTPWDSKNELNSGELIGKIAERGALPILPNGISKEARAFLKGCFVRKTEFRLTANMLLHHPFLEGLKDDYDDGIEEFEEVLDLYDIESILFVSESDDELSYAVLSDEWDDSYSDDEEISSVAFDEIGEIEKRSGNVKEEMPKLEAIDGIALSTFEAGFHQSKKIRISSQVSPRTRQHVPLLA